ncbi:hypothetical protein [Novosphingobium jiangmenense]|uniref:Uncharacterized protein n=1 Tax=Novosphingobium jiangmenense TaxID=2791981 RepID=A0ABS0HLM5_9SPHN|nr:hypothetical protein [Novosphingobium jiangmenense]MBF9153160.1 hypothetical protein [Novosphingobium jiangmenense]
MALIWLSRGAVLAILLYALRKGEEPERLVAVILVATGVLDGLNHAVFGVPALFLVDPGHLVIDSWALLGLTWVALRANRGWPLWACSAQVIVVLAHMAKLIDLSLVRYGYFAMTQLPIYIQSAALLAGTSAHLRREGQIGRYHAWRLA